MIIIAAQGSKPRSNYASKLSGAPTTVTSLEIQVTGPTCEYKLVQLLSIPEISALDFSTAGKGEGYADLRKHTSPIGSPSA
jgi:hypothetical protein